MMLFCSALLSALFSKIIASKVRQRCHPIHIINNLANYAELLGCSVGVVLVASKSHHHMLSNN
jgi:hypothetical protein